MCQGDSIKHGGCTLFFPFAAFGVAWLMDGTFLLLLGAHANKREIRCNNQPLWGLDAQVNANNNLQSAGIVQYKLILVPYMSRLTSGFFPSFQ
jgi:hypothetical protein